MSPTRRRDAVVHVQRDVGISQRRACRALGQPRSTQRYRRRPKADEVALLQAIEAWVCQHPCYGYRMIHALLVVDGFKVGRDRIYRLWRSHGYGVKGTAHIRAKICSKGLGHRMNLGSMTLWAVENGLVPLDGADVAQKRGVDAV